MHVTINAYGKWKSKQNKIHTVSASIEIWMSPFYMLAFIDIVVVFVKKNYIFIYSYRLFSHYVQIQMLMSLLLLSHLHSWWYIIWINCVYVCEWEYVCKKKCLILVFSRNSILIAKRAKPIAWIFCTFFQKFSRVLSLSGLLQSFKNGLACFSVFTWW